MRDQIALIAENVDVSLNEGTQLKKASSRHLLTATPSCNLRTCHVHIGVHCKHPYNGQLWQSALAHSCTDSNTNSEGMS